MRAILEPETDKPTHPRADEHVQAAHVAAVTAQRLADEAKRAHEQNFHRLQTCTANTPERYRAERKVTKLHEDWLEKEADALEAWATYQARYADALQATRAYWEQQLQETVAALCRILQGDAFQTNEAVCRTIALAAADDVTLNTGTFLEQLRPEHLEFLITKLRENCGLQ